MVSIRLTKPQRETLLRALKDMYPHVADFDDLLLRLDQRFDLISVPDWTLRRNMKLVIRTAEQEGWLLDLVRQMHRDVPEDPRLQRLEDELAPLRPPPDVDYFEVCRLAGRRIMVDRANLRATLKLISNPLGSRIMVITGESGSGKSHSVQLMSYLTVVHGGFSLVYIDLKEYGQLLGGTEILPSDIARSLVKKLGYDFKPAEPATDKQWARWVLDFCDDFEAFAQKDEEYRWVVIDGFGEDDVKLRTETLDLIKGLATRINVSLTRFRLILLGYDDVFPPVVLGQVEEDPIEPIGERELAVFFGHAYTQLKIPFDADKLAESVIRVLEGLDPGQPGFLAQLEPLVCDELIRAAGP